MSGGGKWGRAGEPGLGEGQSRNHRRSWGHRCPSRCGSRGGGRWQAIFRPEQPVHNAAACSDKGGDGTQRCGSGGPAAALTRQETEPQTCVPTSAVHSEFEAAPAETVGAEVSESQGPGGAEATFQP